MRVIIIILFGVLTACSLPKEVKPDAATYMAPREWMSALNITRHVSSRQSRFVGERDHVYIIFEAGLSQACYGDQVLFLAQEPRLWRGEIYLPRSAIAAFKNVENNTNEFIVSHSEWAPHVLERKWQYIVVHHSDTESGNKQTFHEHHVNVNGWDELGYHFVIGNGKGSGLGEVEIGPRWRKQKHGAHAKTPDNRYNDFGIGICLVGDFCGGNVPHKKQMDALVKLVKYMQHRYNIPKNRVLRHCDTKVTDCPGESFPWYEFLKKIHP